MPPHFIRVSYYFTLFLSVWSLNAEPLHVESGSYILFSESTLKGRFFSLIFWEAGVKVATRRISARMVFLGLHRGYHLFLGAFVVSVWPGGGSCWAVAYISKETKWNFSLTIWTPFSAEGVPANINYPCLGSEEQIRRLSSVSPGGWPG